MKITFVLPVADWGGGCRVVATYAQRLIQMGHDVVAVHRLEKRTVRNYVSSVIPNLVNSIRDKNSRSHLDALKVPQICIPEDREVTDADIPDADVVIATYWMTAQEVLALSPSKGAKAYFIQHFEVVFDEASGDLVRATWRYPMRKIVVAPWLKEIAELEFSDSTAILVPNGVDTKHFTAPPRLKSAVPTAGFVFSHASFKCSNIAIEAVELLKREIPGLRLVAFGSSWKRRLKNGISLPSWVEYTVRPAQDTIPDIYKKCDVWICASQSEGFGLPMLEAMACRTPVVSTPAGIASQLATMGGLYLAPYAEPYGLSREIRRVLELPSDEWSALSQKAYITAQQFDMEQSALKFEKVLEAIAAER